ncbi:NAD-dependent epimerase/dehydratase family protein [Roseofilum casamattae]|uniref:UDP-glucose 4-epimerase n=1 Tax=Roseofilum casamattae BLCC-M143 TaxID=3022442 RepID=A0ABT7BY59_9CYAN|nr:NAD-dependent epimerase/dehydratase family protein [Roseofilum casamattae]MDJ1183218.1 NAD-dependent epimerase/dehydratase family protein [Roseofilum casamattae BLCC-M143]
MRVLVMGGTRFIGVYLTRMLVEAGHEVVLFNRGNQPAPVSRVKQIHGDRTDAAQIQDKLADETFDAVFDNNGRKLSDTQPLADLFAGKVKHFVYMSSAGVYLKSEQMPHIEGDELDPNSRHKGKFEAENYLIEKQLPFTSIRPTYIYGPLNYNPLETWFFDRIVRDRPIPIPGSGNAITQFGHCADLAKAMISVLGNDRAIGEIYNVSGERYVTFDGLAKACAIAAGVKPEQLKLVHYNPKDFDFGKRKAFPLRVQHFFADISKAKDHLNWKPEYDLISGLKDSFQNDYLAHHKGNSDVDFELDDLILNS